MSWITPKTDWTSTDRYNFGDINRVESNTNEIRNLLMSADYEMPLLTVIANRTYEDYDTLDSVNRLESNLDTLKSSFVQPLGWQPTITWTPDTKFTYAVANRWEQSLSDLYELANQYIDGRRFCGTFASGQEGLP